MKTTIVGNWKMNQTLPEIREFFSHLEKAAPAVPGSEMWIAPQYIHLGLVLDLAGTFSKGKILVGAQNSAPKEKGALTGEVSPFALKEMGAAFTILGHSERRTLFHESHELLREKAAMAIKASLKVIFCVGETLEEREKNQAMAVVESQILMGLKDLPASLLADHLLLAYEPVWAIGTGKTATPEQAQDMHSHVRKTLEKVIPGKATSTPILYGGSVNPSNISELLKMKDIDGALVGGASLRAPDYLQLCNGSL